MQIGQIVLIIILCVLLYLGYVKYVLNYSPIPNTPVPFPDTTLVPIDDNIPTFPPMIVTSAPIIDTPAPMIVTQAPMVVTQAPTTQAPMIVTPAPTTIPYQPLMVRYIKLMQPAVGGFNVGEIMAFAVPNDGVNLIKPSMTTTSSKAAVISPASNVIDGNINTFFDAWGTEAAWVQVDLGMNMSVGMVRVYNRQSCCQKRLNGAILVLMDANQNVVYHSDPLMDPTGSTVYKDGGDPDTWSYNNYSFFLPSPVPVPSQIN